MEKKRPLIGVSVLVFKEGKVLLGKRKNAHGQGTWQTPGGHLEFGEEIEDCARREVFEEVGIQVSSLKQGPFTNDIFEVEQKHYITFYVIAEYESGNVELKEPEKCEGWVWFDWNNLPQPLFLPVKNLLKMGFTPEVELELS